MVLNRLIVLIITIFIALGCSEAKEQGMRKSSVAGSFYPGDSLILSQTINQLFEQAGMNKHSGTVCGLIAPHAGYTYSGQVAAYSYHILEKSKIKRVIILSPSHHVYFRGVSVYAGNAYQTPLGVVRVDETFSEKLCRKSPVLQRSTKGHINSPNEQPEHALEVQIPFLQCALENFTIVPIVMGEQSYETCRTVGHALAEMIHDDETIIVASSDLSHYHQYDEAVKMDHGLIQAIQEWDYFNLSRNLRARIWEACGGGPIITTMIACEYLGATEARLLKYANSGDIPGGDKSGVVGYTAMALIKNPERNWIPENDFSLNEKDQKELLDLAKESVEQAVRSKQQPPSEMVTSKKLLTERGAFVTLEIKGQLRGCIGYTAPILPLYKTVERVAVSAALDDPRFPAVREEELKNLSYSISVLSPFLHIRNINDIVIGKHGLLIKRGQAEGLLLPQVATEQGWERVTFLEHTCLKAGLPKDTWKDPACDIFLFSAFVFGEGE